MSRSIGLEMLTLLGMPPVEYVTLAGELGCGEVSTGLTGLPLTMFGIEDFAPYPEWSLRDDPRLRAEMKAAMADAGVQIGLGEGFRTAADVEVSDFARDLDLFAELGALRINAIGMEPDQARSNDQLAQLAGMAIERGLRFTVEFCPTFAIGSFEEVEALIDHIGNGRVQVLLDSMHFFRSGGTVEQLRAVDPGIIGYVQLADSPFGLSDEEYMARAMFARDVPGEGELPLKDFIAALPAEVTISLEVPRLADLQQGMTPAEHAARCVRAMRKLGG